MGQVSWSVGVVLAVELVASGCRFHSCTDKGLVGSPLSVALVDDDGAPVVARGETRYLHHQATSFDCTVRPEENARDADCQGGVLQLAPVYNPSDTLDLRFQLDDGSFTDWLPVHLSIEPVTVRDFNGPDCDVTVYDAAAEPVVVPASARLAGE